jgi:hypothetical protein
MFVKKLFAAALLLGTLAAPTLAQADQFFDHPNHPKGNRLDWCATWASNCGQPAADEFCRREGFGGSIGYAQDPGVGFTHVLQDDRMFCWGQPCDGFRYIICN